MGKGNPNIVEAGRATRFQPGVVNNPAGRPRRKPVSEALREELEKAAHGGNLTKAQMLAAQMVGLAMSGDMVAAKLVLAYTEGLPTQSVDLLVRREAERLAEDLGISPDDLLREAELILSGKL